MSGRIRVGLVSLADVRFHHHNVRRDLGDLRGLSESIKRHGVLQPVVVEEFNGVLRLRAGHRRVVAARMAGLRRIPAVIHAHALDELPWLLQAVQENTMRRQLGAAEKRRTVQQLRDLGCSWRRIAEAFDVSPRTAASWVIDDDEDTPGITVGSARTRATRRLIAGHLDEFHQLLEEERGTDMAVPEQRAA